jgi:hypothetical protein
VFATSLPLLQRALPPKCYCDDFETIFDLLYGTKL